MNQIEVCDMCLQLTEVIKKQKKKTSESNFSIKDISLIDLQLPASIKRLSTSNFQYTLKYLFKVEMELSLNLQRIPTYFDVRNKLRMEKGNQTNTFIKKLSERNA